MLRLISSFALLMAFGVLPLPVASAAPASDDPASSKVWELTDYLKGNAGEIRYKLNHEVERLAAKVADSDQSVRSCQSAIAADEKAAL